MQTKIFETKDEMVTATIALLSSAIAARVENGQTEAIMLSGGSTPKAVYEAIAASPLHAGDGQVLFMSDERLVPLDADTNNFHNTLPMIESLGAIGLRVQTEQDAESAAADYAQTLHGLLDAGTRIPLGLLGMGADGHTASLFTDEDIKRSAGKLAVAVDRPDGMQGVSVTPDFLANIDKIVFLVAGADKAPQVQALLNEPHSIAAGQAIQNCKQVELWVDCTAHG